MKYHGIKNIGYEERLNLIPIGKDFAIADLGEPKANWVSFIVNARGAGDIVQVGTNGHTKIYRRVK